MKYKLQLKEAALHNNVNWQVSKFLSSQSKVLCESHTFSRAYHGLHMFALRFNWFGIWCPASVLIRELKQPRRRRQQKPHKFAYLTMENSIFARFARAYFIFWHFEAVLVLSTTWNDLCCSCVDDVSIWWQMFNFVFLCPKRLFQFNSRTVRTHFSRIMSLNNWKMIAETRSYIFRWRSRFRRRRVCLSSLLGSLNERQPEVALVCYYKLKAFSIVSLNWAFTLERNSYLGLRNCFEHLSAQRNQDNEVSIGYTTLEEPFEPTELSNL